MSYNAKRLLAGAAAVACAVSLSSCGADTKWAARSSDTELRAGIYIYNLLNEYYAAMDHMTDTDTDVLNITIDEKPSREWILEQTKEDLRKYIAVENKFTELGMELSDDDKTAIKEAAQKFMDSNSKEAIKEMGATQDIVEEIL